MVWARLLIMYQLNQPDLPRQLASAIAPLTDHILTGHARSSTVAIGQ